MPARPPMRLRNFAVNGEAHGHTLAFQCQAVGLPVPGDGSYR